MAPQTRHIEFLLGGLQVHRAGGLFGLGKHFLVGVAFFVSGAAVTLMLAALVFVLFALFLAILVVVTAAAPVPVRLRRQTGGNRSQRVCYDANGCFAKCAGPYPVLVEKRTKKKSIRSLLARRARSESGLAHVCTQNLPPH